MKFIGWTLLLLAFCSLGIHAQVSDSVIVLKEVEAKGIRFGKYTLGAKIFTFDSTTLATNKSGSIADLLSSRSLVSINSYGPEGMTGISIRGGSSRHTTVVWNGFNLRNAGSGMLNFSALSTGSADQVSIQSGGSSTMYGSGASTGIIFLSNNLQLGTEKSFGELTLVGGSFGRSRLYSTPFGINLGSGSIYATVGRTGSKFSTSIKAGYQCSENNFRYKASAKKSAPIKILKHAAFNRFTFSQQNVVRTSKNSKLESDVWYSHLNKQIPSLMTNAMDGTADQEDKSFRGALNFSLIEPLWSLKVRSGLFSDKVNYIDSLILDTVSLNQSLSFINEIEGKIRIGQKFDFNLGLNKTDEFGKSTGYSEKCKRNRGSIYGRINLSPIVNRLYLSGEGRQEFLAGSGIPFVFSFSGKAIVLPELEVKGVFSKHYALPVFDDLYWAEDGFAKGNPTLKPEYGYNGELGIAYHSKQSSNQINIEITGYRNKTHDLICWGIDKFSRKSMPSNISLSKSSGIEFSAEEKITLGKSMLEFNALYGYTHARLFDSIGAENSYQRYYMPLHKANLRCIFSFKNFKFEYTQLYNSRRYYNKIYYMKWYTLGNLELLYFSKYKTSSYSISFKVNNVFNAFYMVMNEYAQPLRNFSLGINLTL
jgi:vitamin B12 transporter